MIDSAVMYINRGKGVAKQTRFTKSTSHTGNQLGPPSPCMGECGLNANMSSKTSYFAVGDERNQIAFELADGKVNPMGGDGLIDTKWMDGKHLVESACLH